MIPSCDRVVSWPTDEGSRSVRYMVSCATAGDTITFDASLINQSVLLKAPTIAIDKELYFIADPSWDITITNEAVSNTSVLVAISDEVYMEGLNLVGQSADGMILKVEQGGAVEVRNGLVDKTTIHKE